MVCSDFSGNLKSKTSTNIFSVITFIYSKIFSYLISMKSAKKGKIKPIQEASIPFVELEVLLLHEKTYKFQVNGLMPTVTKHRQRIETTILHFAEITPFQKSIEADFLIIQGSCDTEQLCQIELILEELAEQLNDGDYTMTSEPYNFHNGN